ncbi:Hypothetical predicted protein [Lecanosticta acicola]|uniref:Uncharacterized protein n=1 Tax=Lecanosticta acicola TaxID=111012 RepID=A0AAI8W1P8_9PEZI|nr:Hypothetical predicted protein [Lecanosticta acicola]
MDSNPAIPSEAPASRPEHLTAILDTTTITTTTTATITATSAVKEEPEILPLHQGSLPPVRRRFRGTREMPLREELVHEYVIAGFLAVERERQRALEAMLREGWRLAGRAPDAGADADAGVEGEEVVVEEEGEWFSDEEEEVEEGSRESEVSVDWKGSVAQNEADGDGNGNVEVRGDDDDDGEVGEEEREILSEIDGSARDEEEMGGLETFSAEAGGSPQRPENDAGDRKDERDTVLAPDAAPQDKETDDLQTVSADTTGSSQMQGRDPEGHEHERDEIDGTARHAEISELPAENGGDLIDAQEDSTVEQSQDQDLVLTRSLTVRVNPL